MVILKIGFMMKNNFKIIVPVYNAEQWIGRCLESIVEQDYDNYSAIVIDDHSTDSTWDIIKKFDIESHRNYQRVGSALANIVQGINRISNNKNDIIVTVDGDDYLADNNVLSYLNEVYQPEVWMTYGSFLPLSGKYKNTCQDLSHTHTFDDNGEHLYSHLTPSTYRKSGVWVTSHLRTFKRWLWDKIDDNDLRDENGEYFKIAGDLSYMYSLIEMAGSHVRFVDKILYMYNDLNPNCDGTVNPKLQINTGKYIQSKKQYTEL